MKKKEEKRINISSAKNSFESFMTGKLKRHGAIHQVYSFLKLIFLYKNGLDNRNRDLLDSDNSFINKIKTRVEKITEQLDIELKDIIFLIQSNDSSVLEEDIEIAKRVILWKYRKYIEDNNIGDSLVDVVSNAVNYGSGYWIVYEEDGVKMTQSVFTLDMKYNPASFKGSEKVIDYNLTIRQFLNSAFEDADKLKVLEKAGYTALSEEEKKKAENNIISLKKVFTPTEKENEHSYALMHFESDTILFESKVKFNIYKLDYIKRDGYDDAIGKSIYEENFNIIVNDKIKSSKLNTAIETVSTIAFQQNVDNEHDFVEEENITHINNGTIIPNRNGNEIKPLYVGGDNQVVQLKNYLVELDNELSKATYMGDVLSGNSGNMPYSLASLLNENQSTVHKKVKKKIARWLTKIYKTDVIPYILNDNSKSNINDYLTQGEIDEIINYKKEKRIRNEYIESVIKDENFDSRIVSDRVEREVKKEGVDTEDIKKILSYAEISITPIITGELISVKKRQEIINEIKQYYLQRPDVLLSKGFENLLKKDLGNSGISDIELSNIINGFRKEIKNKQQQQPNQ